MNRKSDKETSESSVMANVEGGMNHSVDESCAVSFANAFQTYIWRYKQDLWNN